MPLGTSGWPVGLLGVMRVVCRRSSAPQHRKELERNRDSPGQVDTRNVTRYTPGSQLKDNQPTAVILKIRHKGLEKLYEDGSAAKVNPDHADKLRRILARLEASSSPDDMNLPGYRLHKLKGEYEGFWSVRVSGNWRVIFRFEGEHATDVDYVDYH
jgi:proteic killer suppression protein